MLKAALFPDFIMAGNLAILYERSNKVTELSNV